MDINKNIKEMNIYPSKITRRILAYLADIFLALILGTILFELVVFQLSRLVSNYDSKVESQVQNEHSIFELLYQREILFYDKENEIGKYNLTNDLTYTFQEYLRFYVFDSEEFVQNDIFYNYYNNYYLDSDRSSKLNDLNELYLLYGDTFFDQNKKTILGTYQLKDEYKEIFSHNYIENDEMSSDGYSLYNQLFNDCFLMIFGSITDDISINDLTSLDGSLSYVNLRNENNTLENDIKNIYVIDTYISFLLASIILFLIIPIFTSKRQTIGEKVLKLERVNKRSMEYLKRPFVINIFLLRMFDSLTLLLFIPALRVGINYIFSMSLLFIPSLIGLFIALINLIIILIYPLNLSLKEITTDSIVVDSESINEYYTKKYDEE